MCHIIRHGTNPAPYVPLPPGHQVRAEELPPALARTTAMLAAPRPPLTTTHLFRVCSTLRNSVTNPLFCNPRSKYPAAKYSEYMAATAAVAAAAAAATAAVVLDTALPRSYNQAVFFLFFPCSQTIYIIRCRRTPKGRSREGARRPFWAAYLLLLLFVLPKWTRRRR